MGVRNGLHHQEEGQHRFHWLLWLLIYLFLLPLPLLLVGMALGIHGIF